MKPRARRELAEWTQQVYELSQRHAARLIPVPRMTLRYEHHRECHEALRVRLRELAGSRVRYGYRRLTVLLQREGWEVNAKRVYRLYVEEGLIVRTRRRKERTFRIVYVHPGHGVGGESDSRVDRSVTYDGREQKIDLGKKG